MGDDYPADNQDNAEQAPRQSLEQPHIAGQNPHPATEPVDERLAEANPAAVGYGTTPNPAVPPPPVSESRGSEAKPANEPFGTDATAPNPPHPVGEEATGGTDATGDTEDTQTVSEESATSYETDVREPQQ